MYNPNEGGSGDKKVLSAAEKVLGGKKFAN
jgi:hypothetical protein